jgi:protein-tyrosine phosphatase
MDTDCSSGSAATWADLFFCLVTVLVLCPEQKEEKAVCMLSLAVVVGGLLVLTFLVLLIVLSTTKKTSRSGNNNNATTADPSRRVHRTAQQKEGSAGAPESSPIQEIVPHVYLGSEQAVTATILRSNKISKIINARVQVDDQKLLKSLGIVSLHIPVRDSHHANIMQYFPQSNAAIESEVASGGNVLVHCDQGVSRSPTLVAAYLMWKNKWSRDQALSLVQSRRSVIRPNSGFMDQLLEWQKNTSNSR